MEEQLPTVALYTIDTHVATGNGKLGCFKLVGIVKEKTVSFRMKIAIHKLRSCLAEIGLGCLPFNRIMFLKNVFSCVYIMIENCIIKIRGRFY